MSRYGRPTDQIAADIAYAVGEDIDIVDYLRQRHRLRGWCGPTDNEDPNQ